MSLTILAKTVLTGAFTPAAARRAGDRAVEVVDFGAIAHRAQIEQQRGRFAPARAGDAVGEDRARERRGQRRDALKRAHGIARQIDCRDPERAHHRAHLADRAQFQLERIARMYQTFGQHVEDRARRVGHGH